MVNTRILRRPNRKVAGVGDSITAQNHGTTGSPSAATSQAIGPLSQAHALGLGQWDFDSSLNFGVNGDDSGQLLARLDAVIAAGPALAVLLIGTNDQPHGLTLAQSWANIQAIVSRLLDAGIKVLHIPVLPRSNAGDTAPLRQHYWSLNHLIKNAAKNYNPTQYMLCPADAAILDPGSAIGGAIAGPPSTQSDGLHPVAFGALRMGLVINECIRFMLGLPNLAISDIISGADAFDATANVLGVLNVGASMAGTGGTIGTGGSGAALATGWSASRSSGTTMTFVTSKDSDGAQVLTLGGGSAGSNAEIVRMIATANAATTALAAGTKVVCEFDVEATSLVNVRGVYAICQPSGTTGTVGLNPSGIATDRELPTWRKKIVTPPIEIVTPGAFTLNPFLQVLCDASGAGVSGALKVRFGGIRPLA